LKKNKAFSLVEMMIVVALIVLFSTMAVSVYHGIVIRSHRQDARDALTSLEINQNKVYIQTGSYTSILSNVSPVLTNGGRYSIGMDAINVVSSSGYIATATAIGSQAIDTDCSVFTLRVDNGNIFYSSVDDSGQDTSLECW